MVEELPATEGPIEVVTREVVQQALKAMNARTLGSEYRDVEAGW